jgi:hypothetical protein
MQLMVFRLLLTGLDWKGLHRLWKDDFVRSIGIPSYASVHNSQPRTLDVAGGTGDIAFRIIHELHTAGLMSATQSQAQSEEQRQVIICDINPNMLEVSGKWLHAWASKEEKTTKHQIPHKNVAQSGRTRAPDESVQRGDPTTSWLRGGASLKLSFGLQSKGS